MLQSLSVLRFSALFVYKSAKSVVGVVGVVGVPIRIQICRVCVVGVVLAYSLTCGIVCKLQVFIFARLHRRALVYSRKPTFAPTI